jgi:hypothetical protein
MAEPIQCPKCGTDKVSARQNLAVRQTGENVPIWISMWFSPIWILAAALIIGIGVIQSVIKGQFFSAIIGVALWILIAVIGKIALRIIKSGTTTLHKLHCGTCGYSWEQHNNQTNKVSE